MKTLWLLLAALGLVVPYALFVPWVLANGVDIGLFIDQATASPIATFFTLDVLISAVAVLALCGRGIAHGRTAMWAPVFGTLLVGVSFGLPLYLYLSEDSGSRGD